MNVNRVRLATPTPDFNRFADDQVLTAGQLNRVLDYFVDQQSGTRAQLLGCGIACGLGLQRQGESILLDPGVAVSSDGDLMVIRQRREFTQFSPFTDADAQYPAFRVGGELLPMWELHQADSGEPGLQPLSTFAGVAGGGFSSVQVVLYLEHYLQAFELCNAEDCDNRGPLEVQRLRVLLVARSAGLTDPLAESEYFRLPLVNVPRIPLSESDINRYDTTTGLSALFVTAIDDLRGQLIGAFAEAAKGQFAADIAALPVNNQDWSTLLATDRRFSPVINDRGIQYVYAFFQDLADAWHDWRECLLELDADCLPDPARYPRHSLLGEPVAAGDPERRHRWHPGPVHESDTRVLAKARLLLRRIQQMLSFFQPGAFNSVTAIRLTPSRDQGHALGERAIPYYLNPSDEQPLFQSWDPEASRRRRERDIPSYFAGAYNSGEKPDDPANKPWGYHRGGIDFIRIEGHLGQDVDNVFARLNTLKTQHNLPFQVLMVQLEDRPDKVKLPPNLRFPDLETSFYVQQLDIARNLREARSFNQSLRTDLAAAAAAAGGTDANADERDAADELTAAELISGNLDLSLQQASATMPLSLAEFRDSSEEQAAVFSSHLSASLNSAGMLGTATVNLLRPTRETPVQRLADGVPMRQFGLIRELFDKRRKLLRERSIFARFITANPGLEHLGGVRPGGTFVLVYAADDDEVLADFALPYYSIFDMSTLDPEPVAPEPVDPGATPPVKPPYVISVPDWSVINASPVFTLQGTRVREQVTQVRTDVTQGLDSFLAGVSIANGGATSADAVVGVGTGVGVDIGSIGGAVTDPRQQEILGLTQGLRREQESIQTRIDRGLSLRSDETRAVEIDQQLAELIVEGSKLDSLQVDDASLGSGDRAFIQALGVTAVAIRDVGSRNIIADQFDDIKAKGPNSVMVGNLGNLAPGIRP